MKSKQYISASLIWCGLFLPAGGTVAYAQTARPDNGETISAGRPAPVPDLLNMKGTDRPTPLKDISIEQRLDSQLPLDATFRDETGRSVRLGDYFGKRPVVLTLVYYDCPMLCTQILNGMVRAAKVLTFVPGQQYDVVVLSFDARERPSLAAAKKAVYMKSLNNPAAEKGWHFLTGDVDEIKKVTEAVGFHYKWDVNTAQFAHASAIYVLTPGGKLAKYFYGIDYSPKEMRFALVEASQGKIGTPVDQLLLFCYHFDPVSARYTPFALGMLRLAGAGTVLTLGGFVVIMLRREQAQKGHRAG